MNFWLNKPSKKGVLVCAHDLGQGMEIGEGDGLVEESSMQGEEKGMLAKRWLLKWRWRLMHT